MKLLKLKIHNIASIEDAEIDFQQEPLASSEVFLITGKTGAGKSTILDAICLALFSTTPRMAENLTEKGKDRRKGSNDKKKGEIKYNDVRLIMRRNTAEAWVELTFEGNNGLHYVAQWSVALAHKKLTGALQDEKWSLHIVESNKSFNKKKEVNQVIQDAIGLDFNQFCRTTMLAQGEFTRFLNSTDDDKSVILEKITGVEIYTKIGVKVFEIKSNKEKEWNAAMEKMSNVTLLSDTEQVAKRAEQERFEKEFNDTQEQHTLATTKRQWLIDDKTLATDIKTATDELDAAQEALKSDKFLQQEQLVNDWNNTIEQRGWLNEMNEAQRQQREQQAVIKQLESKFKTVKEGERWIEDDINDKTNSLAVLQQRIVAQESKKSIYEQEQTITANLTTIINCQEKINGEQVAIDNANKLINGTLKEELQNAQKQCDEQEGALKIHNKELKELEQKLEDAHLKELRKKKDDITASIGNVEKAEFALKLLEKAQTSVKEVDKDCATHINTINSLEAQLVEKQAKRQEEKAKLDASRSIYDLQRESVEEWTKNVREHLKVGDTCPVCQRIVDTPLPHEEDIEQIFAKVERELNIREKAFNDANDEVNKTEAEIKATKSLFDTAQKKLSEANKELEQEKKKATVACRLCGVETIGDNIHQVLDGKKQELNNQLESLSTTIGKHEQLEKQVKKSRQKGDALLLLYNDAKKLLDNANKAIDDCKAKIAASKRVVEEKEKELDHCRSQVSQSLASSEWENDWKTSPRAFISEIKKAASEYFLDVENMLKQSNELEQSDIVLANVKGAISATLQELPQWSEITAIIAKRVVGLTDVANALRTKAATAQKILVSATAKTLELNKRVNDFLVGNPQVSLERLAAINEISQQSVGKMQVELQGARNNVLAKQTSLKEKKILLEKHLDNKPIFQDDENIESLESKILELNNTLKQKGEAIGAIKQMLEQDKHNRQQVMELKIECDKKKEIFEKWNRLNNLIGSSDGKKFRTIAQSYILENLIHSANSYMTTLSNRYTLSVVPGTFRINVEDAYQGYASRAVSTISGGESFLVSLALALALSDIAQQLRVDMLFIDEGFGTLSGEPLQNAINTLRTLHNVSGRQVGIISHVEELRERIPVQIQVKQEGNSSSSSISVVP